MSISLFTSKEKEQEGEKAKEWNYGSSYGSMP